MHIECFTGAAVAPYLDDLARLRGEVFRTWPYLYDSHDAYERDYLTAYAKSAHSVFVLAFDGSRVVGAATGIPLADDTAAFHQPFVQRGIDIANVFYFGESVLLPPYRGQGMGHAFFDHREAHAKGRFGMTAFCAVERDERDPRRPLDYRGNDAFWAKRGYRRQDEMFCILSWKEVDRPLPVEQRLRFWLRELPA
jgi:GNAT superfamily N-acetyltransferase